MTINKSHNADGQITPQNEIQWWKWKCIALGIKDSQIFIFNFFSTMQELTNWQGFCSKITFLYISFTTSSSAIQEPTFKCCLLAKDKRSFLGCSHKRGLKTCTVKADTTTMKINPTLETSFPQTSTVTSCRKWGDPYACIETKITGISWNLKH